MSSAAGLLPPLRSTFRKLSAHAFLLEIQLSSIIITVPSLRAFGRGATCAVPRPPTLARAHGLRSQSSAGLGKDGAPNARPPVVASVLCVFALPLCMPGDFRAARGGGVFRYVSCCRAAAVGQAAPTAGPCL